MKKLLVKTKTSVVIGVVFLTVAGLVAAVAVTGSLPSNLFLAVNRPTIINVSKVADTDDGGCNRDCSLREAVKQANLDVSGRTIIIRIPAGNYLINEPLEIENTSTEIVLSGHSSEDTIIQGQSGIFTNLEIKEAVQAKINGLTIKGALYGIVARTNSRFIINDSEIRENTNGLVSELNELEVNRTIITENTQEGFMNSGSAIIRSSSITTNGTYGISCIPDSSDFIFEPTLNIINSDINFNGQDGILAQCDVTMINSRLNNNGYSGIYFVNGSLRINNSEIKENSGTGLFFMAGDMMVADALIEGNHFTTNQHSFIAQALGGGGVFVSSGQAVISDSAIINNISETNGGGVYSYGGNLTIISSTVESNSAVDFGGAIYSKSGSVVVDKSLIADNNSAFAAAVYNNHAFDLNNSTVYNNENTDLNEAVGNGIIYNDSAGTSYIFQSTISNNILGRGKSYGLYTIGNDINLKSSIIASHSITVRGIVSSLNCFGGFMSFDYNVSDDTTCDLNNSHDISNSSTVGLLALADNGGPTETLALASFSVAADLIPVASCNDFFGVPIAEDQRGRLRPDGNFCDAGAYEHRFTIQLFPQ